MTRNRLLPSSTLADWLARIGTAGEPPDRRLAEAAADLVDTMSERPEGVQGALYRFGHELGADGWPIAQVGHWLQLLEQQLGRRHRRWLNHYTAHASVAQGWADGYVRGAHTGMCIDPTSGLVTAMVLRLRLAEVYESCVATASLPADRFTMLLIDIDLRDLPRLEADLLMACVADSARAVFHEGETIARSGERVMVLAANTEATRQRGEILADRLHLDAATRRAHATVLLDPLPDNADLLDRYLRDLVG